MGKDLRTMIRYSYMPLNEEQGESIRQVFKAWLRQVHLPPTANHQPTRDILIALVDEPE